MKMSLSVNVASFYIPVIVSVPDHELCRSPLLFHISFPTTCTLV